MRNILAFLIPLILVVCVAALFKYGVLPNRLLVVRLTCDLVWLALFMGILTVLIWFGSSVMVQRYNRELVRIRQDERATQIANRQQFLRRLDHELKNPLTTINLGVANLRQSVTVTPEQKTSLERIEQQVKRLQKLVVDLRRLTEMEECRLEKTRLNLCEILQETVETCCSDDRNSRIALHSQTVPWSVGPIFGDRDLLVAALYNLLDNALKFTGQNGVIEVHAFDDGHVVTIEIADSGVGIPADELTHVFEELYRGKNARGIPGSGLGLSLVQKIVLLHNGIITIHSREGQGTIVTVRLPLAPDM